MLDQPQSPSVQHFFDSASNTFSYVVWDEVTRQAAIIDSVLNYQACSGRTSFESAEAIIDFVKSERLVVSWVLETHIHADHLSAAPYLKNRLGGKMAIGSAIKVVQQAFGKVFNSGCEFQCDGSQFDHLFHDGEEFTLGTLKARALHTPGHTPACVTYVIGDAGFVGDTIFMPDFGTARCDFPGGDARELYKSIQKIFALPDKTRLFMCHDYKTSDREGLAFETTVKAQKDANKHVGNGRSEDDFVLMRQARDAELAMPSLIFPSVQINMRAGQLPPEEDNGVRYLKLPLNMF